MTKDIIQVALIGQPNVGKSALFTRLTGVGVICSNYPGTTVEFEEAILMKDSRKIRFIDLPGSYSLSAITEDERVVIDMLLDDNNDLVVVVGDASDLSSSLSLFFEITELGIPVVLALNRYDVASKRYTFDFEKLSQRIGAPVVPVSAKTGVGIEELLDVIASESFNVSNVMVTYRKEVTEYIDELTNLMDNTILTRRGRAIKLLECADEFAHNDGDSIIEAAREMSHEYNCRFDELLSVSISTDRFLYSSKIRFDCVSKEIKKSSISDRISEITVTPITGIPILISVLIGMLLTLVYAGKALDEVVIWLYETFIGTAIVDIGVWIGGDLWEAIFMGIDGSIQAILCLVVPYIMVFYLILGVLEDSGYLPRAVVLMDRTMHRIGLHGGGFIPIMVGVGCNVPAILATRTVSSRRERRILCTLIVMCVPCSAQMSIIIGTVGTFAGLKYSALIAVTLLALAILVGVIINKRLPPEPSNLAFELPDMMIPSPKNVLYKMWARTKDFFSVAVPILVIGSIVVEILLTYDLLNPIVQPLSFLTVTMLGLPAVTIIGLIVGVLRKEMAYGMLLILAGTTPITTFMDPQQFVVFGIVMATYMPCLATLSVLGRGLGWKDTAWITLTSISVAIALGTLFNHVLGIFI